METIVIAGAGTMGASMALSFARFGFRVHLYDISEESLIKGRELIENSIKVLVSAELVAARQVSGILDMINSTTDIQIFAKGDVVIESIVERIEIKEDFYRSISKLVKPECIVCSNTSAIPISAMGEFVLLPERFLGMHWFNPAHLIPLIEIIKGDKTGQKYASKIYDLAKRIDKEPVIINKDVKGFVANRIQFAIMREALYLVENEVVSPDDLDKVMKYSLGLRYASSGPLATGDFGGLDTFLHISKFLNPDLCDCHEASKLLGDLVATNRLGLKTGRGFYDYDKVTPGKAISQRDENLLELLKICR